MTEGKTREESSLLDILIDGFEKNETLRGYHWRDLPMPSVALAAGKFEALVDEARRWKGETLHRETRGERRRAAWADLEIRQAGRGIRVLVKAPRFDDWWHHPRTWADNPMGSVSDWMLEETSNS